MTDDDTPLYHRISAELLFDPLPAAVSAPPGEVHDDHDLTAVDPTWFLSFDEVDSRTVRNVGAPE